MKLSSPTTPLVHAAQLLWVVAFAKNCCLAATIVEVAHGADARVGALVNPLQQVLQLLSDLEMKITKDAAAEDEAYKKYVQWCKSSAQEARFEIKTATGEVQDLTAAINKADADISTSTSQIEELGGTISGSDADLKAASQIREKELGEFLAAESELTDVVDTLDRAISILQRKLHGSAMVQAKVNTQDVPALIHALSTVVDAASLSLRDKQTLLALAQARANSDEDDDSMEVGAPAPTAYKSHSESIIDVLEDLREKAQTQLSDARKQEVNQKHSYDMLKQSLEDQIAADTKDLGQAKSTKTSAVEAKGTAQGDLAMTKKALADAEAALEHLNGGCLTAAADHEASSKTRSEELVALAAAKKAIAESTSAAGAATYGSALPAALIQFEGSHRARDGLHLSTRADLVNFEVVNLVRQLAKKHKSAALAQLAGRIGAVLRYGSSTGEDPFVKVKSLIEDLIARLEQEAGEEASHKAYCDKEMASTKEKLDDLTHTIDTLTVKIDKKAALAIILKDEVKELQAGLATLAKTQVDMDAIRSEEHAAFLQLRVDLQQGLDGVRKAMQILREYYASPTEDTTAAELLQQPTLPAAHEKASGAATGLIGMLEVIESDFGKGLAQAEMEEDDANSQYEKTSMENRVTKAMKEQDLKYKSKEAKGLDTSVTELSSDRRGAQSEIDAVYEYNKLIIGACVAKPETYEERRGRREAEIAGLRQALAVLDGEAVLLQGKKRQSGLRGATVAPHRV